MRNNSVTQQIQSLAQLPRSFADATARDATPALLIICNVTDLEGRCP